jgi:endoglucanase
VFDTTQLSHPGLVRRFRDVAEAHDTPYQLEVLNHGGTDASLTQRTRGGVAVITLSIPARYIHTVNETAHLDDIAHSIQLLARVLEALDAGTWQVLAPEIESRPFRRQ